MNTTSTTLPENWNRATAVHENLPPWNGVGHVYLMGANGPSHAVDVTESLDTGIESLRAHRSYLDGLGRDFDPAAFLREFTAAAGTRIGVRHAVAFQQIRLQGV
ncbi:hypothetical protein [Rhodococcus rhodochrous]|uniref:hypothetical protein n=1 Tax=Rhodococcus rhodochrous TaxID=1829 RepID=UPI000A76CD99|nr:hypothetical protein [Rhodococcus rhodochrous]